MVVLDPAGGSPYIWRLVRYPPLYQIPWKSDTIMGKALVIVESPAKAKTINKYLGRDFVVKSSIGHIRDLPVSGSASAADAAQRARSAAATRKMSEKEKLQHRTDKAREQLVKRMGVDPTRGWRADYQILPGKEKVVAELRKNVDQFRQGAEVNDDLTVVCLQRLHA